MTSNSCSPLVATRMTSFRNPGEGPLSYAMRRACDRQDTLIMDIC